MSDWRDIPALVRHSTVAIYGKSTGGGPDGFIKALRISRDTLAKQGYVYYGEKLAVLQDIKLTSKGWLRNRRHEQEGRSGEAKDRMFAQLWKSIESRIPDLDGPSGKKSEPPKNAREAAEREKLAGTKPGEKDRFDDRPGPVYPPPK
jgi:hypothetical protein